MQQRRDEILAKKAKLAELKRQRELRKQDSANRQSLSGSPLSEVRLPCLPTPRAVTLTPHRSSRPHRAAAKTSTSGPTMSITSSTACWARAGPPPRSLARPPAQDVRPALRPLSVPDS
jgi:hypothetical protein